jgi:hypothetical protein
VQFPIESKVGSFALVVLNVATPFESVAANGVEAIEQEDVNQMMSDEFEVTTAPSAVSRLTVNVVVSALPYVAADWGFDENATCVAVAPVMVTPELGFAGEESTDVATENVVLAKVWAPGLVIPAIVNVPAVEMARAQPPLLTRVIVTIPPAALAEAVHLEKPPVSAIVGVPGMVNAAGSVAVMVLPVARAPTEEVLNPTAHVDTAPATVLPGVKVTLVGEVSVMVMPELGFAAAVSCEVAIDKAVLRKV